MKQLFEKKDKVTFKRRLKHAIASYLVFQPVLQSLGYKVVEKYEPTRCRVYKVYKDNTYLIAKAARKMQSISYEQVKREYELLRQLTHIKGIPKLVGFYLDIKAPISSVFLNMLRVLSFDRDKIIILIREFISGEELPPDKKLTAEQYNIIQTMIAECHSEGFVGLDISRPRNIIITQDGFPYFIDLGTYTRKDEVSTDEFKRLEKKDFDTLEYLKVKSY